MDSLTNVIIVRNTSLEDIDKSVLDMANLYADTDFVHPVAVYKAVQSDSTFLIKFPTTPDFDR
ncbi:MAG: hypothetical protein AAF990_13845, partial [Bacteroidota bacterium]